jgi:hypothetical protein
MEELLPFFLIGTVSFFFSLRWKAFPRETNNENIIKQRCEYYGTARYDKTRHAMQSGGFTGPKAFYSLQNV